MKGNAKYEKKTLTIIFTLLVLFGGTRADANKETPVDLDRWADAIYLAEGGDKARYSYGIRSIPYSTVSEARRYCKNTVYNTLVKYRKSRCNPDEKDIDCLARRYCPVGASNDKTGINKNWKKNVLFYLNK